MNKVLDHSVWGMLIVLTLSLSVANIGQAKITEVDLSTAVGIWLFDEGSGDSTKDMSSKGNHAKLTEGPKWVSGKFGKALEFNGEDNCVQTEKKTARCQNRIYNCFLDQTRKTNCQSYRFRWSE